MKYKIGTSYNGSSQAIKDCTTLDYTVSDSKRGLLQVELSKLRGCIIFITN